MSRIGRNPVSIPEGVKVDLLGQLVKVTGPKGALEFNAHRDMKLSESDGTIIVDRPSDVREHRSLHGTTRQMINNMVIGVSVGYSKELEIIGVGYLAQVQGIDYNFSWVILMIFILICRTASPLLPTGLKLKLKVLINN